MNDRNEISSQVFREGMNVNKSFKTERLYELDGLKTIACFVVFVYHILNTFYVFSDTHTNLFTSFLTKYIFNGGFMVMVFACISGYFAGGASAKSLNTVIRRTFKRYIRFFLLVFAVDMIVLLLSLTFGFHTAEFGSLVRNYWVEGYYTEPCTMYGIIKDSALLGSKYDGPLWALRSLVIGPCFIYFFDLCYWKGGKLKTVGYFFLLITLIASAATSVLSVYILLSCYLGALGKGYQLEANIGRYGKDKGLLENKSCTLFSLGITAYVIQGLVDNEIAINILWILTAVCLVDLTLKDGFINKTMKNRFLLEISPISLSVYMLHYPLLCSMGLWFYMKLYRIQIITTYISGFIITSILSIAVVILVSELFHFTIERGIGKLISRFS